VQEIQRQQARLSGNCHQRVIVGQRGAVRDARSKAGKAGRFRSARRPAPHRAGQSDDDDLAQRCQRWARRSLGQGSPAARVTFCIECGKLMGRRYDDTAVDKRQGRGIVSVLAGFVFDARPPPCRAFANRDDGAVGVDENDRVI
jgi:hypothetical protein